jgi:hypothetical protein
MFQSRGVPRRMLACVITSSFVVEAVADCAIEVSKSGEARPFCPVQPLSSEEEAELKGRKPTAELTRP